MMVRGIEIVLDQKRIEEIVQVQASKIAKYYVEQGAETVSIYPVQSGAMYYTPALMSALHTYAAFDMKVVKSLSELFIGSQKHLLVIDTIYDTGETANQLLRIPPSWVDIQFAFLVRKERQLPLHIHGWVGQQIPEKFVIGYGLDDEKGCRRELPFIGYEV